MSKSDFMNTSTQIAKILDKRQPLAKKVEQVKENLQMLSSILSYLDEYRYKLQEKVQDQGVTARLQEIDFSLISA